MVYFVLTVAVIYPFADEMMSLLLIVANKMLLLMLLNLCVLPTGFTQLWVFWLFCVIVFKDSVIAI